MMLARVPTVVHMFYLPLDYSGIAFGRISLYEKLEAFLEGHVRAFSWLGDVVDKVIYDNVAPVSARSRKGMSAAN